MADWTQTKRDLINAFAMIIRTSPLAGQIEQQPLLMALDQILSAQAGRPTINLGPLNDYLINEAKADPDSVTAALLFFQSRQERWGVVMELPPPIATLPPAKREEILAGFASRGATSGTYAGRDVGQRARAAAQPEQPEVKSPPAPSPKKPGGSGGGLSKPLVAGLVLVLVAGVASVIFNSQNASLSDPQPVKGWVLERGLLPCEDPPRVRKPYAFCVITKADREKLDAKELEAMVENTHKHFARQGFTRLQVTEKETGKIVAAR